MNIARSALQLFASRILKSISSFIAVVIFSRELGASALGTYYPFIALLGIAAIPADLGIRSAAEKRISEGSNQESYLGSAIVLKITTVLVVCIFLYLIRDLVNTYLGQDLIALFVIILFIDQIGGLSLPVLRGELRVGETAIVEVARPLSWLVIGYIFVTLGYGVEGLIYGYLFGTILILLLGWWRVSVNIGKPTLDSARSLFDYGKYSVVALFGGYIFSWVDVFILTLFVVWEGHITRTGIGAYENAWRLSLLLVVAARSISTAIFPQFSQWDAENARDRIELLIPKAALPALLISIPSFVGVLVLSKDLLRVLFGPEFVIAWVSLIILSAGMILQSVNGVISKPLKAIDKPDLDAYATASGIFANISLNFAFIWLFGISGAAAATAISLGINTIASAYFLNKFLTIKLPFREMGWSTIAASVMGIFVYQLTLYMDIVTIVDILVIVLLGVIVYTPIVLVYSPIRSSAHNIVKNHLING